VKLRLPSRRGVIVLKRERCERCRGRRYIPEGTSWFWKMRARVPIGVRRRCPECGGTGFARPA